MSRSTVPSFRVADLSSCHLPGDVMRGLCEEIAAGERAGAVYDAEGCWLWVSPEKEPGPEEGAPAVCGVEAWARRHGFEWVRLDQGGAFVPDLPRFNW